MFVSLLVAVAFFVLSGLFSRKGPRFKERCVGVGKQREAFSVLSRTFHDVLLVQRTEDCSDAL